MTSRESLAVIVADWPEERLQQLLDYARFLAVQDERRDWQRFSQSQLARAYGTEEPDYDAPALSAP